MITFNNPADYRKSLEAGILLPSGFRFATTSLQFSSSERETAEPYAMNLALILAEKPCTSFAGMFTQNAVKGAPVLIARERMAGEAIQGILINNKIANVCCPSGREDAEALLDELGKRLDIPAERLISASTGIIGWKLPIQEMLAALPELAHAALPDHAARKADGPHHPGPDAGAASAKDDRAPNNGPGSSGAPDRGRSPNPAGAGGHGPSGEGSGADRRGPGAGAFDLAKAIMTTDSYPKLVSVPVGEGTILGIAKGAGMIEPNMATMLVFLLSDLEVSRESAGKALSESCRPTFNRISVDGDQSTSDMALFLSTSLKKCAEDEFKRGLLRVCTELAEHIVRNGEGCSHVIKLTVEGAGDEASAEALGKAVLNSPLVKSAVYGNDPNVGRIVSAIGDFCGSAGIDLDLDRLEISIGGEKVFSEGCFLLDREREIALSSYLEETAMNPRLKGFPQHDRCVEIIVKLGLGRQSASLFAADLSHEYVRINADYRT